MPSIVRRPQLRDPSVRRYRHVTVLNVNTAASACRRVLINMHLLPWHRVNSYIRHT